MGGHPWGTGKFLGAEPRAGTPSHRVESQYFRSLAGAREPESSSLSRRTQILNCVVSNAFCTPSVASGDCCTEARTEKNQAKGSGYKSGSY